MPLPDRYADQVPDMEAIWAPEGYFRAQTRIWVAQCEARYELLGTPSAEQVEQIRQALALSPNDIKELNVAKGHETNKLLRLVQNRLDPETGNFLHKGNTSSDVLDTSLSLQNIAALDILTRDYNELDRALEDKAKEYRYTVQVGRTHGQHAIPQVFGRQVLGWMAEIGRGGVRIDKAKETIAVGKLSGEIGTHVFIEPVLEELALAKLGLRPDPAPTQVISRDQHAEVIAMLAVNAGGLERVATNIRLLSMPEVGELREPFDRAAQQGSSAMPHKRNPELSERICGLAGWVRVAASGELGASNLWLERDISHSSEERFSFPDAYGCLAYATRLATFVIKGMEVFPDKMRTNLDVTYGAIYSPSLLNSLIDSGQMSRTEAYELVKGLVLEAMDQEKPLLGLARENEQINQIIPGEKLAEMFSPEYYLRNIDVAYKRLGIDT